MDLVMNLDFYAARYFGKTFRGNGIVAGVPLTGELVTSIEECADLVTLVVAKTPEFGRDCWAVYSIEFGYTVGGFERTRKAAIESARHYIQMGASRTRFERAYALGDPLKGWQP